MKNFRSAPTEADIDEMIARNFRVTAEDETELETVPKDEEDGQGEGSEDDEDSEFEGEGNSESEDDEDGTEAGEGSEEDDEEADAALELMLAEADAEAEAEGEDDSCNPEDSEDENESEDDEDEDEEVVAGYIQALADAEFDGDVLECMIATGAVIAFTPAFSHENADIEDALNDAIEAGVFSVTAEDEEIPADESDDEDEGFESDEGSEDDEDSGVPVVDEDEDEDAAGEGSDEPEDDDEDELPLDDSSDGDEEAEAALNALLSEEGEGEDEDEDESEGNAEGASEDEDEDSESEEADAMYTPVVSLEEIDAATADDVDMHLYEDGKSAHWTVLVAGRPAACIASDSVNPQAREFFSKPEFKRAAITAMSNEGVASVLQGMGAEFYATMYTRSEMAEEIRASVQDDANSKLAMRAADMHETLIENAILASTGFDKNFWAGAQNPFKGALFEGLTTAGMSEQQAIDVIETAAPAMTEHLRAVMAKAVELMNMPVEARDVIAAKLNESSVLAVAAVSAPEEIAPVTASTFAQALTTGLGVENIVSASVEPEGSSLHASMRRHFGNIVR